MEGTSHRLGIGGPIAYGKPYRIVYRVFTVSFEVPTHGERYPRVLKHIFTNRFLGVVAIVYRLCSP